MLLLAGLLMAGGQHSYFTSDYYPPKALIHHEQGKVVAHVRVGVDGRVASCTIKQSSGSQTLDEDACDKLVHRAHFNPAHDTAGKAIEGEVDVPMSYVLPN